MTTKTRRVFITKFKQNESNPDLESVKVTKDIFPSDELRVIWLNFDPMHMFEEFQVMHDAMTDGHKLCITYNEETKEIYEVDDVVAVEIRKN